MTLFSSSNGSIGTFHGNQDVDNEARSWDSSKPRSDDSLTMSEILGFIENQGNNSESLIYVTPPEVSYDTDKDSDNDKSDDEHEAQFNNLGTPALVAAIAAPSLAATAAPVLAAETAAPMLAVPMLVTAAAATTEWWSILAYFLDVAIVNTWLLYRKIKPQNSSEQLLNFRHLLALTVLKRHKTCRTVAPESDCFTPLSYPTRLFYQCDHDVLVTLGRINIYRGCRNEDFHGRGSHFDQITQFLYRKIEDKREACVAHTKVFQMSPPEVKWIKIGNVGGHGTGP
ncbi:hypothetical protein ANN_23698 [Periplaneta americana]|uniref:Uncharacterized protein n=1 Tax=Periplaneta americana TaxID=6978 RepID=A0ABQ8SMA6_PERAM|nr:hypothetical protein ANN_23698 [Periplaneta americana]